MASREQTTAEGRVLSRLRRTHPDIPSRTLTDLRAASHALRTLFQELTVSDDGTFRQGRIAVIGLVCRAQQLYVAGIQQLAEHNTHAWSGCFRGMLESSGALLYIQKHPTRAVHLMNERGVKAVRLRDCLATWNPSYARDLDRVSRLVHPGDLSILASLRAGSSPREVRLYFGRAALTGSEVLKGLACLCQSVEDFTSICRLPVTATVLQQGTIFMKASRRRAYL